MVRVRERFTLIVFGALILTATIWARIFQIDRQVLLDDEWHAIIKLTTSDYGAIATSFGIVDHSIPLTLLFKWIASHGWLSEFTMVALPLACGVALCVIMCVAMSRVLPTPAFVVFGGLVAISPLLVLYARQARPYAITLLFALIALWAAWRWAERRQLRYGVAYVIAAVFGTWLHVIVAPTLFGVWLYLSAQTLLQDPPRLRRIVSTVAPGVIALVLAAVLLTPAFVGDWGGLRVKAGADHVTPESAVRALMMWLGTGSVALASTMAILAIVGAAHFFRNVPRVAGYVTAVLLLQAGAVVLSGALWISQPMVLARYLLIFLPFVVLAVAAGFGVCLAKLLPGVASLGGGAAALCFVAVAYALGPLPGALHYPNAFVTHQMYFADFDPAHNQILPFLKDGPLPEFYRTLSRRSNGEVTLLEAPWRFESMFNRQPVFQEVHRQHVKIGFLGGVCPPGAYGEHPRLFSHEFRNFVDLAIPDEHVRAAGDFLVIHRHLELANMTQPWQSYEGKGLPPVDDCIPIFRRRFGDPVFEDDLITVFRLRG